MLTQSVTLLSRQVLVSTWECQSAITQQPAKLFNAVTLSRGSLVCNNNAFCATFSNAIYP